MKEHNHQEDKRMHKRGIQIVGIILMLTLLLTACSEVTITTNGGPSTGGSGGFGSSSGQSGTSSSGDTSTPHWGAQTQTSNCHVNGALEDKKCTPGAIFPDATTSKICVSGYSKSVRNVPISEKDEVYRAYGIYHHSSGQYEVDHLVSLELGGSNDIANLWPEAASPKPGFHEKDQVENYLHDQVCSGKISLHNAQAEIANNWLDVYNSMPASAKNSSGGYGYGY